MNDAVRATRARVHLARCVGLLSAVAAVGCTRSWPAMEDCRATEAKGRVTVSFLDPVDVLFVIDDGPSMAQEQALLAREVPRMVDALLNGAELDPFTSTYPPGSLHAGVVSADLGAGGLENRFAGCSVLGDDGVLRRSVECGTDGRPFVWHFDGFHDPAQSFQQITCNTDAGANGCAIAQPLEAALKALLPLESAEPNPKLERVGFADAQGHGATQNRGFFRADPRRGQSLLLVLILTDKDDCSLAEPALAVTEPGAACAGGASLRAVQRYVDAFRAFALVEVAIIAGLPPDLELGESDIDLTLEHETLREAYYDRVLRDPRVASPIASPSCESASASAHAPRRLIEFARRMRGAASVHSICRDDFRRALRRPLQYGHGHEVFVCSPWDPISETTTECRLTWELPLEADPEQPLTPTRCSDRPEFLRSPRASLPQRSERGRTLCEVPRIPVPAADGGVERGVEEGFFIDIGPPQCPRGTARVGFTQGARPPHGVAVELTCTKSECASAP